MLMNYFSSSDLVQTAAIVALALVVIVLAIVRASARTSEARGLRERDSQLANLQFQREKMMLIDDDSKRQIIKARND